MSRDPRLALEYDHPQPVMSQSQLPRCGKTDDPRPDDDDVALARRILPWHGAMLEPG